MGSNLDAGEIQDFLRPFDRDDPAPYLDWRHDPRRVPPLPGRDVLNRHPNYSDWSYLPSEYTTSTATPSVARSLAPSTVRSAAPSSVFSSRLGGRDDLSSVGQSTAPSRGAPRMTLAQQFGNLSLAGATAPPQARQILWCEFEGLLGCPATFRLDDERGWIRHHARHHLRDQFPRQLMCWFCDPVPFVAGPSAADRADNFETRMQHVREHVFGDDRLTSARMRPDFYMVQHMYDIGLLSWEEYQHAMAYDETPEAYRLPTQGNPNKAAGLYHDLDKEKRNRKRDEMRKMKEAGQAPSWKSSGRRW